MVSLLLQFLVLGVGENEPSSKSNTRKTRKTRKRSAIAASTMKLQIGWLRVRGVCLLENSLSLPWTIRICQSCRSEWNRFPGFSYPGLTKAPGIHANSPLFGHVNIHDAADKTSAFFSPFPLETQLASDSSSREAPETA